MPGLSGVAHGRQIEMFGIPHDAVSVAKRAVA
jgi:hypothetical protein